MNIRILLLIALTAMISCTQPDPVKVIFDTDIGGDADDLGALVMLNHLHNAGECELLGVMCWQTGEYAVAAIDAVNTFYGNPDIPVGIREHNTFESDWMYNRPVATTYPHDLTNRDAPLAVTEYRRILAGQPDGSVTVVPVGPLKNILDLIESGPDEYSELTGNELINKKVKQFVVMGGKFPAGEGEWNFNGNMPGVTRDVFARLEVPVVFSGFEIGVAIKTGAVFNELEAEEPLTTGYLHFSEHAPWINAGFKGEILDNSTFDQTAVLYAVRGGEGIWWDRVEGGYCEIDPNGDNRWVPGEVTNQSYLVLREDPEVMAELIEGLMLGRLW